MAPATLAPPRARARVVLGSGGRSSRGCRAGWLGQACCRCFQLGVGCPKPVACVLRSTPQPLAPFGARAQWECLRVDFASLGGVAALVGTAAQTAKARLLLALFVLLPQQ